ncbi:hypothetical protein OROHE_002493 [Orobanche hederae]
MMDFNLLLLNLADSSSDDEIEEQLVIQKIQSNKIVFAEFMRRQNAEPTHGGSVVGHRTMRNRAAAAENLFNNYFSENPLYNEEQFHRRYRMARPLFLQIVDAVKSHDNYFTQRRNASGKVGLSTLQKISAIG